MDVINDEKSAGFKMRVEIIIFEIRKWVAMRPIDQRELQLFLEAVLRKGTLRRPLDKLDAICAQ